MTNQALIDAANEALELQKPLPAEAPTLLAALESIVSDWEHAGKPPLEGVIGLKNLRAGREAINAAKGELI